VIEAGRPRREISGRMVVVLVASLLGLADATYLTLTHYTHIVSLICPSNLSGSINCEAVTTSPESSILGIPVAVLGLPFFIVMLVSALPPVWRSSNRYVAPARLAASVVGIGFVCYLLYAELYQIGKICLYCTGVHVLTFIVFIAIVTGWSETRSYAEEVAVDD
jgi:uncharacterized membrane protein